MNYVEMLYNWKQSAGNQCIDPGFFADIPTILKELTLYFRVKPESHNFQWLPSNMKLSLTYDFLITIFNYTALKYGHYIIESRRPVVYIATGRIELVQRSMTR